MRVPTISRLPSRLTLFVVGALAIGAGIAGIIRSGLGVAPYDTVNTGLAAHLNLPVGTASWITAGTALAIAWILGRRPRLGTLLSSIATGIVLNFMMGIVQTPDTLGLQITLAGAGFAGLCTGIAMIVVANLGAGAPEELMLGIVGKGLPLHQARWVVEATFLAAGALLGGSLGVGTFLIVVLTGPTLAVLIPAVARVSRLPLG